jgi:anti-sigma factor RsiW
MNATVGLIGLISVGWAFMTFTPWILMLLGGAAGAWIGEKVTGQSGEDYTERDDDLGHGKATILLALSLILGGVGFVQGDAIKKGFDAPPVTPVQVQQNK